MDLVVHAPGVATPFYIDLTVVSTLSSDALSGSSSLWNGVATEIAAKAKYKDYPNCSLTPFGIEDHGRLGEEALKFVRTLAFVEPSERSKSIRSLHRSLSATLQRVAADAVIAATAVRAQTCLLMRTSFSLAILHYRL